MDEGTEADGTQMIGVYLSGEAVSGVLLPVNDGGGECSAWTARELNDTHFSSAVSAIHGVVQILAAQAARNAELAVAVAVPGHIDKAGRTVTLSHDLREGGHAWLELPLAAELSRVSGFPVTLINDANALAVQDQHTDGDVDDRATVLVSEYGVGCGVIANGRLVAGSGGSAGEIGHIRVNSSAAFCRCGGSGCLERVASMAAIRAALADLSDEDPEAASAASVDVVRQAGHALGCALTAVVNLLNPAHIVIHGPEDILGDDAPPVFLDAVKATAASPLNTFSDAGSCRIHGRGIDPLYLAAGAATYARHYAMPR